MVWRCFQTSYLWQVAGCFSVDAFMENPFFSDSVEKAPANNLFCGIGSMVMYKNLNSPTVTQGFLLSLVLCEKQTN